MQQDVINADLERAQLKKSEQHQLDLRALQLSTVRTQVLMCIVIDMTA